MSYDARLLFEIVSCTLRDDPRQTLRQIADKLRVSDRTIEKVVRGSIGRSFRRLRAEIFLVEVKRVFMTQPSTSIKAVSLTLGFKSCSSFARAVKRASGLTPRELRSCQTYNQEIPSGVDSSTARNLRVFRRARTTTTQ